MYDEDKIINDINEEHKERTENPKSNVDPTLAIGNSSIDKEQKKREYLIELSKALGITQHREELDKLNQSVTYLAERMAEDRTSINEILQILKGGQVQQTSSVMPEAQNKMAALSEALPQLLEVWKMIKGEPQNQEEPLISQSEIREKMKQTFYDNLETGESINNFIKNSLKKSVTKTIIQGALKDIGKESLEHGPL